VKDTLGWLNGVTNCLTGRHYRKQRRCCNNIDIPKMSVCVD
jgi:hypothetical protein